MPRSQAPPLLSYATLPKLAERAFANGLIVWPNAGSIGGREGDLAMIAPPFTLSEEEIELLGERLAVTLEEMR